MILLKRLGVAVLLVVILPAGCCIGWVRYSSASRTITVFENIPDRFPLLVVAQKATGPTECRVLLYEDLPKLQTPGNAISFFVTPEVRSLCEAAAQNAETFFAAGFRIESEEPGRQSLLVSATWDDDWVNRGWYEATHDQFVPTKYQTFFGPGLVLPLLLPGIPAWLAYCVVLALLARRGRMRAAQQGAAADEPQRASIGRW